MWLKILKTIKILMSALSIYTKILFLSQENETKKYVQDVER